MDNAKLDTYQLDLLMVVSWGVLSGLKLKKPQRLSDIAHPSGDFDKRKQHSRISSLAKSRANKSHHALINETTTKDLLRHTLPPHEVQINTPAELEEMGLVCYQHSLELEGCLRKHHRQKPKVKGSRFTGAILSDAATFLSLVELFLCYHAWCHHSNKLPVELQEDAELVSFSAGMVVLYYDTIVYQGDDTVDTDTCKTHTQWHTDRYFLYSQHFEPRWRNASA